MMRTLTRRIRGALGMSVTWAVLWTGLSVFAALLRPAEGGGFPLRLFASNAIVWINFGLIGGLVFGVCLASDGRSHLRQLSVKRAAILGAISALAVPFSFEIIGRLLMHGPLFWFHAQVLTEFGIAGAACGAAVVALARRNVRDEVQPTEQYVHTSVHSDLNTSTPESLHEAHLDDNRSEQRDREPALVSDAIRSTSLGTESS